MNRNPLHALNTLPPEMVRRLASGADALAAKHIVTIDLRGWRILNGWRWRGWMRKRSSSPLLVGCKECHHTWLRTARSEHGPHCLVGRVQADALYVIAVDGAPLPKPLEQVEHPQRRRDDQPGLRIAEVSSHERSDGRDGPPASLLARVSRTEAGRPGGDPAVIPEAPSYAEPWAWDPKLGVVVDSNGNTVANMILTDLSVLEQEEFGRRIAVAVTFCREVHSAELRIIERVVDETLKEEERAITAKTAVIQ